MQVLGPLGICSPAGGGSRVAPFFIYLSFFEKLWCVPLTPESGCKEVYEYGKVGAWE